MRFAGDFRTLYMEHETVIHTVYFLESSIVYLTHTPL